MESTGLSTNAEYCMYYNSIQAILKELDNHNPETLASNKGMLRWSLHKRVEDYPSSSLSLVRVLVKELDKVDRLDCKMHVIPLLHTLSYVLLQTGHIPSCLYERVHDSFRSMLTLPEPYCTVALSYLRNIKTEQTTPGALYLRRAIAEQNLKNELIVLQEKVFVFADSAVFSAPLGEAVRADLEMAGVYWDRLTHEQSVVLHTLQTGLGHCCQDSILEKALRGLGKDALEKFFRDVVCAVEQKVESSETARSQYQTRLQHIHAAILTAANQARDSKAHCRPSRTPLPSPEITFQLWKEEEELWDALKRFALNEDDEVKKDFRLSVDSVLSTDSGIEKDLTDTEDKEKKHSPGTASTHLTRKPGFKNMPVQHRHALMRQKTEEAPSSTALPKEECSLTARVVVMGDDRVLGRLAEAYQSIRERESRRLILTRKVNLQMYYIPVTDAPPPDSPDGPPQVEDKLSLASLLGRVDPWYESNINSLAAMIPKLAQTTCQPSTQPFLLDVLSYYLRSGIQPVYLPLYSVKITLFSSTVSPVVEAVFVSHLCADFPEFSQLKEKNQEKSRKKRNSITEFNGAVVSVNYTKVFVSKRVVERGFAPITCRVNITSVSHSETGLDHLTVNFDSTNPKLCTEIQTQNIRMRTLENRTFTVCLDKDSRRTLTNVQSIEISPCIDPGYCVQKSSKPKYSTEEDNEVGLSKYIDKVLPLPINTFTGITH